jgi:Bacterial extracellular solute-binding proteins, family 3
MTATLHPGTLIVASATPDPPFEFSENGVATGFDMQLMQAIFGHMGLILQLVRFTGANFNDIFDYLEKEPAMRSSREGPSLQSVRRSCPSRNHTWNSIRELLSIACSRRASPRLRGCTA